MPMLVNITSKVNSKSIRKETLNDREHWVVPSATLPFDVVMNDILYPRPTIEANYQSLEGALAPLGHPKVNGKHVSALSPEGLNLGHVGAWNRNVKLEGNRVAVEKWIDIEVAGRTEKGRELLDRVEELHSGVGEPISTSVAVYLESLQPNSEQAAQGIKGVADIRRIDHDAILLHEAPAASTEQGVGMMVNADLATPFVNAGVLAGESYREKETRLNDAAKARFVTDDNDYVWVMDFTDSQAVLSRNGGIAELYGYSEQSGRIVFDASGTEVTRQESWVARLPIVNQIMKLFSSSQARPDLQPMEGDMPLTKEEKAELIKDFSDAMTANMAEALKPINDKVDALQANHKELSEALSANAKAEEAEQRKAVAAVHGDVIANGLSGEALQAMFKSLDATAAPIGNSAATQTDETGAPDPATYFGGK